MNAVISDWPSGSANTGWPSEPSGMRLPGRVEGWPAGTQRAASPAQRLLSQAVAWWDASQYRNGDRFLRNLGTGGELLDLRLGSSIAPNSNDPLFLAPEERGYVYLPGASGNFLSVPDEAALDITGDIDLRAKVAVDNWKPSGNFVGIPLIGKYNITQEAYLLAAQYQGNLSLRWTDSGNTTRVATSSALHNFQDGEANWARATLDVDNGNGQCEVKFYTSQDDGATWTQLGNTITGTIGPTSIRATDSPVTMANQSNSYYMQGRVYRGQIISDPFGTPTTVLDIDCDAITSGSATSFTAVTNQTVTINSATVGRKSVAVPARSKGGGPLFLLGTDDYFEVQDNWQHGLLNFDLGQPFTVLLAMRRKPATASEFFITKRASNNVAATVPGWFFYGTLNSINFRFRIDDGSILNNSEGVISSGALSVGWGICTPRDLLAIGVTSSTGRSTQSITNLASLRIGAAGNTTTNAGNFEFYAAAIFRRALTADEIRTVSNYFTGRIA